MWQVASDRKNRDTRARQSCHLSLGACHHRQGVALIITLILLGVVTFMAITFLALSRRERAAVATVTDTAGARYAADAALANAEAQIIANVLATTNPFAFGLLVSTNYVNPIGFQSGISSYTNVNYFYTNWNFLNQNDFLQNLTNLYFSPRAPVFIITNYTTGSNDFRYYLDLNRNGKFEDSRVDLPNVDETSVTNGTILEVGDPQWIGILERPDAPHGPNNKFIARYAFIAVPIGNALDLNYLHNDATRPDPSMAAGKDGFLRNQGVGSWEINLGAFLTDLNTNQWEPVANMYSYNAWNGFNNTGAGFDDALGILKYRYGGATSGSYNTLATADQTIGSPAGGQGDIAFRFDGIDGYSDGRLQTTLNTNADDTVDIPTLPWAGSDNTNHFFTHQELFDSNEVSASLVNRLLQAGQTNSTYERYTFYRLLSQLGTDSTPEAGRMNLNYLNVDTNGTVVPGMETNFYGWTNALQFFTNAADRLLRAYTTKWRDGNPTNFAAEFYGVANFNSITNLDQWTNYPAFGIGNIPVWVSNRFVYSSSVNRLLQLAANLYDATTNNSFEMGRNYPSVFRPLFSWNTNNFSTNIYITAYTNVLFLTGPLDERLSIPMDIDVLAATNGTFTNLAVNVYGVPWIIGAKKGFPSFNRFIFESVAGMTRRLQVTRTSINGGPTTPINFNEFKTNQMYTMSVSNYLGAEFWNSYASGYTGAVQVIVRDALSMSLTNDYNLPAWFASTNFPVFYSWINPPPSATWGWVGWAYNGGTLITSPAKPATNSFLVPLNTNAVSLPESIFRFTQLPPFVGTDTNTDLHPAYESNLLTMVGSQFPFPHFGLLTTNRIQAFVLDLNGGAYRIIDHVLFQQISSRDINAEFFTDTDPDSVWYPGTNTATGIPLAILNQLKISRGQISIPPAIWKADPLARQQSGSTKISNQQAFFDGFFMPYNLGRSGDGTATATNRLLSVQAPYSPTRYVVQCTFMQANDPLVHYLAADLNQFSKTKTADYPAVAPAHLTNLGGLFLNGLGFGELSRFYQPWNGNQAYLDAGDTNQYNLSIKDPLVYMSDNWDFPTNKLPTIGWLGRVHRGTPWQTIYLKGTNVLKTAPVVVVTPTETNILYGGSNIWAQWTGNKRTTFNEYYDAANSAPIQDRLLFDLFTTAFNDNATRGTLSVNVGPTNENLAAWSALFSGIVVPTSLTNTYTIIAPAGPLGAPVPVGPPGLNSALAYLVQNGTNGINDMRHRLPGGVFRHVGDVLTAQALTDRSPFFDWLDGVQRERNINDELCEWLPQQTMGLLRCSSSPRYVIYCYGQALKPAPNGIYTGGGRYFGLVTNYQVVSEIATRAVVRFGSMMTNQVTPWTTNISGIIYTNWTSLPMVTNNNAVVERFNLLPPD
jgi:hypothetical protein